MITFEKTSDMDFKTRYDVLLNGEFIDYIGVAYDQEFWGTDWVNGSSEIYDIIGDHVYFKDIKQSYLDNEERIKAVIL